MKFLKAEGVKLVAIQAESNNKYKICEVFCFLFNKTFFSSAFCIKDIVDGDLTLILGMIWTIIQQYQIADISEEGQTKKKLSCYF